jgi:hypothetical protein
VCADTVQDNSNGMDPYASVGDNPETRNDPSGHCWPLCPMILGTVIGAAISVATTVVSHAVQGKPTSLGKIAQSAVVGALASGPAPLASNARSGLPLLDGVAQAALIGGVTAGVMEGAGAMFKGAASAAGDAAEGALSDAEGAAGGYGLSFRADTLVATPTGEQAIGTLKVGQKVQAYNPATKTVSIQTGQHVFVNQDTDLIDITLAVHPVSNRTKPQQVAVVSHGSQTPPVQIETVHTTQKHPWLTTRGWITAGKFHRRDQVQQLDGSTAMVIGLKLLAGATAMYDLTVSTVHTFAVGHGQFVVHNCGEKLFENIMPERLGMELRSAKNLSVEPMRPDDPGFEDLVNGGRVKRAVTKEGNLKFIPHDVNGTEIYHTVITGGEPVLAAGEADISAVGGQYWVTEITNHSGHYLPDVNSLENVAKSLFRNLGFLGL